MPIQNIETLTQLNTAFDDLYQGIESDCKECQYPDCMGYTWLLKEDADRLYELGVSLVQINDGPTFIHSFPTKTDGQPDVSVRRPSCSQLCDGVRRCSIHKDRPFVCHLYPIGFETRSDGVVVWALHQDCLYARRLEERSLLSDFKQQVRSIINNVSPQLLREIAETVYAVEAIYYFPEGGNSYIEIEELRHEQM